MATEVTRWEVMWGLSLVIYAFCKVLTWWNRRTQAAPVWKHLAYLFAWPGMNPEQFLNGTVLRHQRPTLREWLFASVKCLFGVSVFSYAVSISLDGHWLVIGLGGIVGISFTLHFGLFHLLSCWWRTMGIQAEPLMNWPIAARSVSEFWGRRWNIAFRDLTHRFLFRPLVGKVGVASALLASFIVSGLIHELVITVPAYGGWGGPTLYFLIQGLTISIERICRTTTTPRGEQKNRSSDERWRRAVAVCVVLLPVPLLFPQAFLQEIIVPFVQAFRG